MRYEWKELFSSIQDCQKCSLCENRKNIVIGCGNAKSKIMFIGEGPGRDESKKRDAWTDMKLLRDKIKEAIDCDE